MNIFSQVVKQMDTNQNKPKKKKNANSRRTKNKVKNQLVATKLRNVVICPLHNIPMSSLVNAFRDDIYADNLNVETFACMQDNCTKQAVVYGGDVELYLKVREHYNIKTLNNTTQKIMESRIG